MKKVKKIMALLIVLFMVTSCLVAGTAASCKKNEDNVPVEELSDMEIFIHSEKKEQKGHVGDESLGIAGVGIEQIEPIEGVFEGLAIRRLTFNDSDDFHPSWSPDGRSIVFMSDRTGSNDIYKINVDGTGLKRLTTYDNCDSHPVYSPDGRKIMFVRYDDDGWHATIWMMNPDGSGEVEISPTGDSICRGKHIDCSPGYEVAYFHQDDEVYILDADNPGVETYLWTSDDDVEGNNYFRFSPDGTKLLVGDGSNGEQFCVMNTGGTGYLRLTDDVLGEVAKWFNWAPDGRQVVYVSNCIDIDGEGYRGHLRTVNVDGTNRQYIVTAEPEYCIKDPDWGTSGWITYEYGIDYYDNQSIWITRPDGSIQHQLTSEFSRGGGGSYMSQPTFSPDGSKILFVAVVDGNQDIFLIDGIPVPSKVPTLMPVGLIALAALLSVIATISITRRREGK